jgi:hypothetical protein
VASDAGHAIWLDFLAPAPEWIRLAGSQLAGSKNLAAHGHYAPVWRAQGGLPIKGHRACPASGFRAILERAAGRKGHAYRVVPDSADYPARAAARRAGRTRRRRRTQDPVRGAWFSNLRLFDCVLNSGVAEIFCGNGLILNHLT